MYSNLTTESMQRSFYGSSAISFESEPQRFQRLWGITDDEYRSFMSAASADLGRLVNQLPLHSRDRAMLVQELRLKQHEKNRRDRERNLERERLQASWKRATDAINSQFEKTISTTDRISLPMSTSTSPSMSPLTVRLDATEASTSQFNLGKSKQPPFWLCALIRAFFQLHGKLPSRRRLMLLLRRGSYKERCGTYKAKAALEHVSRTLTGAGTKHSESAYTVVCDSSNSKGNGIEEFNGSTLQKQLEKGSWELDKRQRNDLYMLGCDVDATSDEAYTAVATHADRVQKRVVELIHKQLNQKTDFAFVWEIGERRLLHWHCLMHIPPHCVDRLKQADLRDIWHKVLDEVGVESGLSPYLNQDGSRVDPSLLKAHVGPWEVRKGTHDWTYLPKAHSGHKTPRLINGKPQPLSSWGFVADSLLPEEELRHEKAAATEKKSLWTRLEELKNAMYTNLSTRGGQHAAI